jgi:hypothetical protein
MTTDPGLGRLTNIISSDADGALTASPLACPSLPLFGVFSLFISLVHVLALHTNFQGVRVSLDVGR